MVIPGNNINSLSVGSLSTASTVSPIFMVADCCCAGSVLHFTALCNLVWESTLHVCFLVLAL